MSAKPMPSPPQGPNPSIETESQPLPQGHCRYILLLPEIKGRRCACVNFTLNRGLPGATCDCGHLACYHNKDKEPTEMDQLKQRIKALEERLANEDRLARDQEDDAYQTVLARVSGIEELVDRSKEEFSHEIKQVFSHTKLAWGTFQQVQQKVEQQGEQLNQILNRIAEHDSALQRLDNRQLELQDADTYLEERIERIQETLEGEDDLPITRGRDIRPRRRSSSETTRHPNGDDPSADASILSITDPSSASGPGWLGKTSRVRRSSANPGHRRGLDDKSSLAGQPAAPTSMPLAAASAAASGIWTVHISLLPHATIPMPFERNTNAYLRCLSRGLHQVVPVKGPSAEAFCAAVNKAFGNLLKGRPWMPLQAELCNAEQLQGLPMLRPLEAHLVDAPYDAEFLRTNCAVCDASGLMESLYITMREPHALSWHALRHSPVLKEGLEDAWEFDPLLDNDPYDDNVAIDDGSRPAAGDIVPAFPSLKRTASEMQRSNSFGSSSIPPASDPVPTRAKRTCPLSANPIVDLRRPGFGTA